MVAVHPENRPLAEPVAQEVLGLLGAQSGRHQAGAMAVGALPGYCVGGAAVVTAQARRPAMYGEPGIAGATFGDPAAIVALQCGA